MEERARDDLICAYFNMGYSDYLFSCDCPWDKNFASFLKVCSKKAEPS